MKLIVELEDGVWLAPWDGDPGRTLKIENAKVFTKQSAAVKAINEAIKHRHFSHPVIVPVKTIMVNIKGQEA